MKKIMVLIFVCVFLISLVNAATWDDKVDYDNKNEEYTLTNAFGLGDEIAKIKLKTPRNNLVAVGYQKVAEIEIKNGEGDWNNIIENVDLFHINEDKSFTEFSRPIDVKILVNKKINTSIYSCNNVISSNGSIVQKCSSKINGTRKIKVWEDFNNSLIKNKKVIIGLFTNVEMGDKVEWIPLMYGHTLDKWATWSQDLMVGLKAYWSFDENSGDVLPDLFSNNNGALTGMTNANWVTGILGNALNFTGGTDYVSIGNFSHKPLNYSISLWLQPRAFTGAGFASASSSGSDKDVWGLIFRDVGDNVEGWVSNGTVGQQGILSNSSFTAGWNSTNFPSNSWTHVVITANTTHLAYYHNGTLISRQVRTVLENSGTPFNFSIGRSGEQAGNEYNGLVDEMALYWRDITQAEVTELYGSGTPPTFNPFPDVTLLSPTDNTNTATRNITFIGNVTSRDPLANVSLVINGVINQTNLTPVNNTNTSFSFNFDLGSFNWTFEACSNESSCSNATEFSLEISAFETNSETFANTTIEGSTENFVINLSLGSGFQISTADLIWNSTVFTGTIDASNSPIIIVTRELVVPSVDSDKNITFFWNITLDDGSFEASTQHNQTVQVLNIDNCSSFTTVFLNLTLVDEETQTKLNETLENTTIGVDIDVFSKDKSEQILNFSQSFNETNPASVCLNMDILTGIEYSYDATIRYDADSYVSEFYHIQSGNLSNGTIPQNITLFDLLTADSTEFQITFKDSNFLIVEDVLINIARQYVSEGTFKTVEIPKTDSNGQTVAHLVESDFKYNMVVTKNGVVLGTFNNLIAYCEDQVSGSCFINLNAVGSNTLTYNNNETLGIAFPPLEYNSTSRVLTFSFVTTDGLTKTVNLSAVKMDMVGNITACDEVLTSSSGTISCTVPNSIGNDTIIVNIYVDNNLVHVDYIKSGKPLDTGDFGYFFLIFMLLSFPLMLSQSKTGIIIGVILGFIAASLFSFIEGGIIGFGSAGLWLIIAGIILIYTLQTKRES